jgi:hypothetical protein
MFGSSMPRRSRWWRRALGALLVSVLASAACSDNETPSRPGVGCRESFCGPAPVCGQLCGTPCGCCACVEGEVDVRNGWLVVCAGGCFDPSGGGTGGSGGTQGDSGDGDGSAGTADSGPDVEEDAG